MQPAHIKFLLLVLGLFGAVGVYYVISVPSAPTPKEKAKTQLAAPASGSKVVNVTNVRLEKTAAGLSVTGQAQDAIDPGATFFQIKDYDASVRQVVSADRQELVFDRVTADLLIENSKLRGGIIDVQVASLRTGLPAFDERLRGTSSLDVATYPSARFQITRVVTTGGGGTMTGTLNWRGINQEFTLPFTRDGNTIAGNSKIDLMPFGLKDSALKNPIQINWKLGIK